MWPYDKDSFSFEPTNLQLVNKEIDRLDTRKATLSDSIPAKIIKDLKNIISPYIVQYFNLSIRKGIFPSKLKLADVSPIFKKNDRHCKENYRPVSVLSWFSKIFERIILNQMAEFMKDKQIGRAHV